MITEEPAPADVLIIGLGPVGKLLAILLGRAGHGVVVTDKRQRAYPLPRAVTHDSEFARILQSVGLAPDTIPEITEPYDAMYVWRNHAEEILLEVDWSGMGPSGWNNTYFFNQPDLEDRLDEVLGELPTVTVLRGWDARIRHDDGEQVHADLTSTSSGRVRSVTAAYVIGADGATGTVRAAAGIGWEDLGYFFDWLVVDVKPDPRLHFPHIANQRCDHHRPATMVPGGPGRRRWEFMRLPHETAEQLNTVDTAWDLLAPFGVSPANAELERHSVYTFQAGWATQWRRGRVLIAGDAAHLMPPFAGQGLGAGARDAMNLAWKLSAVLRGVSGDELLDSYGPERTPHVIRFIDFSTELGRVICIADPTAAAERDARMIEERRAGGAPPAPPRPRLGVGAHRGPSGGTLSVQGRVTGAGDGAPPVRLDDLVGSGVLLLRDAALLAEVDEVHLQALARLGVVPVALGSHVVPDRVGDHLAPRVVTDVDGTYAAWFATLGADVVLVRPDFYVYGVATSSAETAALVAHFLEDTAWIGATHLVHAIS